MASYYAPNGHYSASVGAFTSPMVNTPLSSTGSGSVYVYGNGFPTDTYSGTNYYVDVLYVPQDDAAPNMTTDIAPNNGATSIGIGTKPVATFADAITPSSLSFTMSTEAGQLVMGVATYDPSSQTATFTPEGSLAPSTKYTAIVSATSAAGAAMSTPKTWSFTTAAAEPPVVTTSTPATDATDVSTAAAPQVVFAKTVTASSIAWSVKDAGGVAVTGTTAYDAATTTTTFTPATALKGSTKYTVSVSASSETGTAMAACGAFCEGGVKKPVSFMPSGLKM